MKAFIFPGQGSQKRGMGEGLFDEVEPFRSREKEIDALLGFPLREVCLHDPQGCLKDTRYTQPCLFVVNALHHYTRVRQGGRPAFVAGHSLGEFNALLAAGVIDLVTGVRLVQRRAQIMAEARGGAMAAVIGLSSSEVARVLREEALRGIDVANFNSASQTVISGPAGEIAAAEDVFEVAGAQLYIPLPVSGAFHSRYMRQAAQAFAAFLEEVPLSAPQIPIVSNVTGAAYPMNGDAAAIRHLLVEQMTRPVQWTKTIRHLLSMGVTQFVEAGPGQVLTKLTDEIRRDVQQEIARSRAASEAFVPLY